MLLFHKLFLYEIRKLLCTGIDSLVMLQRIEIFTWIPIRNWTKVELIVIYYICVYYISQSMIAIVLATFSFA